MGPGSHRLVALEEPPGVSLSKWAVGHLAAVRGQCEGPESLGLSVFQP